MKEKTLKIILIFLVIVLVIVSTFTILKFAKKSGIRKDIVNNAPVDMDKELNRTRNNSGEITKPHTLDNLTVTGINILCEKDLFCVVKGILTNNSDKEVKDKYIKYTFYYNDKEKIEALYYESIKPNETVDIEIQSNDFDIVNATSYKIETIGKEEYEKLIG